MILQVAITHGIFPYAILGEAINDNVEQFSPKKNHAGSWVGHGPTVTLKSYLP